MYYRKEIDGLRAVAVVPVIFFHAGFKLFQGGYVGVDVFFVISGYLITSIILSDLSKQKYSIVTFYERRARRILPALFFLMLCCLPFAWFLLLPNNLKDFAQSLAAVSAFSSNILFLFESGYFATASELKPLLHTWSLAVEEQYYVFFPLFLMLIWKFRKQWVFPTILIVAVLSLALGEYASLYYKGAAFYLLPTRTWELALGALIATAFFYKNDYVEAIRNKVVISELMSAVGLFLILYATVVFDKNVPFPGFSALVPTVGTGLIIVFSSQQTIVGKVLSLRPVVLIGLISYSLYLWHNPMFVFARYYMIDEPSKQLYLILSVLSFVFAYLSWRFVEAPFRNKNLINRKQIFTFALAGSVAFALLGCTVSYFIKTPELEATYRKGLSDSYILQDSPVRVVLWGDSHADSFAISLGKTLNENSISLELNIMHSCPSIIDTVRINNINSQYAERCTEHNESAYKNILSTKPDYVVLNSSYISYMGLTQEPDKKILADRYNKGLS